MAEQKIPKEKKVKAKKEPKPKKESPRTPLKAEAEKLSGSLMEKHTAKEAKYIASRMVEFCKAKI